MREGSIFIRVFYEGKLMYLQEMLVEDVDLEVPHVRNPSVNLSPTLTRDEKVEHYIIIKTHKPLP